MKVFRKQFLKEKSDVSIIYLLAQKEQRIFYEMGLNGDSFI